MRPTSALFLEDRPRERYVYHSVAIYSKPLIEASNGCLGGACGGRNFSQDFMDEILRLKGRGHAQLTRCSTCETAPKPSFRCRECTGPALHCRKCIVSLHAMKPLHIIQRWTGTRFLKTPLIGLGLKVLLGHEDGSRCMHRQTGPHSLVVIHSNSIHTVAVEYCNCLETVPHYRQLLRFGWYPATVFTPATCCTLDALDLFQASTLNGKVSAYSFYKTLVYRTDALGIDVPKNRYQPFLRMIRQYRHVLLMMRGGKGFQLNGASNIKPGELALVCPACPIPDINLPENWESLPDQYLYQKCVSVDACFRFVNCLRSNQSTDPSLHPNAAYMLDDHGEYGKHVLKHASQTDASAYIYYLHFILPILTCSGFKALAHADSKPSTGLRSTGVVAAICARHEMVCPEGVGNLQKGERFCNSDYVVASALKKLHRLRRVLFCYDIVCQWIKGFDGRMEHLPEHLHLPPTMVNGSAIPKAHCPMHKYQCQANFGMGIQPGVGRTDGEAIERVWAFVRMCAASIKEMGPGSRSDTLDDQFGFLNWCKLISMGTMFMKRLMVARTQSIKQTSLHQDFTLHLPPRVIQRWTRDILVWEADRMKPYAQQDLDIQNPYIPDVKRKSFSSLRNRLLEEERQAVLRGAVPLDDTSITGCLSAAFGIEELQFKLRRLTDGEGELTQQEATTIHRKRTDLTRRIRLFRAIQMVYIPGAKAQLQAETVSRSIALDVEDQKLWLPSDFPAGEVRDAGCTKDIVNQEILLRIALCHDALEAIRDSERTLRALFVYRTHDTVGQGARTRAQTTIATQRARSSFAVDKYRRCRRALEKLAPQGSWAIELRPLLDADVANMNGSHFSIDVLMPVGQGGAEMSWLWTNESYSGRKDDIVEGARVEWLKSRARVGRWTEEVNLLEEEMRRVGETLEDRSQWWEAHQDAENSELPDAIKEGIKAYSLQQAAVQRKLLTSFRETWEAGGVDCDVMAGETEWNEFHDPEEGGESEDETLVGSSENDTIVGTE
ncbi:hypothetical protein BDZ89DRAFT_950058 [Hymenopellis radicata]|nr:hypothetical protein BDZ89DRAFT_950058 [Hymenopellis radicata]